MSESFGQTGQMVDMAPKCEDGTLKSVHPNGDCTQPVGRPNLNAQPLPDPETGGRKRRGKKSRKSRKGKKPRKGKKSRKNKRTKRR